MNYAMLTGNLTRDPELSTTQSGLSVCRFTIAVQRKFDNANGDREVDFFNITTWRGLADNCHKYLRKGNKVNVVGSIQIRQYDGNDGTKKTAVGILANEVEFLTPKSAEQGSSSPKAATKRAKTVADLEPCDDDNLPF